MKIEKVVDHMRNLLEINRIHFEAHKDRKYGPIYKQGVERMEIILVALEKQIPKEPLRKDIEVKKGSRAMRYYECASCETALSERLSYCDECGQALLWG